MFQNMPTHDEHNGSADMGVIISASQTPHSLEIILLEARP